MKVLHILGRNTSPERHGDIVLKNEELLPVESRQKAIVNQMSDRKLGITGRSNYPLLVIIGVIIG